MDSTLSRGAAGAAPLPADTLGESPVLAEICGASIAGFRERVFPARSPHALYAAGVLYYSAGLFDQAAAELESSQATLPTVRGLYLLGLCRKEAGDPTGALQAFGRALEIQPDLLLGTLQVADVHRSQGDCESAIALLETTLRRLRGTADASYVYNDLGLTFEHQGDLATAERHFRQAAVARDSGSTPARANRALMLYKLGRGERAREILEEILEEGSRRRTPDTSPEISFRIYYVLGSLALDAGDPREARDLLSRSLSFQQSATAFNTLAIACVGAEDRAGALDALRRAVELDPAYAAARRNLETLLRQPSHEVC